MNMSDYMNISKSLKLAEHDKMSACAKLSEGTTMSEDIDIPLDMKHPDDLVMTSLPRRRNAFSLGRPLDYSKQAEPWDNPPWAGYKAWEDLDKRDAEPEEMLEARFQTWIREPRENSRTPNVFAQAQAMRQRETDVMDVVEALEGLVLENDPALNTLQEKAGKVPSHNLKGVEVDDYLLSIALNRLGLEQNPALQDQVVQNHIFRDQTVWNQAIQDQAVEGQQADANSAFLQETQAQERPRSPEWL